MHVVLITSDDQTFAIPTSSVVEVIPAVECRPLPKADAWVQGVFNYRATLLPLLDFAQLLQQPTRPLHRAARILVLRVANSHEEKSASKMLGLLVQRVLGSEHLDWDHRPSDGDDEIRSDKLLGPVMLTSIGTIQLIHAAGIPFPRH